MRTLRWAYPSESEAAERAAVVKKIDTWWLEFTKHAPRFDAVFSGTAEWDFAEWIIDHLARLSGGLGELYWEFGPGRPSGHRLVVTAEAQKHLRPLVDEIIRRAPALPGWEFLAYRPPEDVESAEAAVRGREGIGIAGMSASAVAGDDGRIDVTFFAKKVDRTVERAAFVVAETLLGEETLNRWVGVIETAKGVGQPLDALQKTVAGLIEARRAALPPDPWFAHAERATWSLLKLEPPAGEDCARQEDLTIGKTADVGFFRNTRSEAPFDSVRYSRHGETFCYLKVDGSEPLAPGGFEDKASIEDALDAALVPRGLGCHIGGGTGRRYSYVDLALTDVDAAIPLIRAAMQKGKLPKRSWLLFFDDALLQEWVGMWPDSPAPMLPAIEL